VAYSNALLISERSLKKGLAGAECCLGFALSGDVNAVNALKAAQKHRNCDLPGIDHPENGADAAEHGGHSAGHARE
jgi:hypothetical protein